MTLMTFATQLSDAEGWRCAKKFYWYLIQRDEWKSNYKTSLCVNTLLLLDMASNKYSNARHSLQSIIFLERYANKP